MAKVSRYGGIETYSEEEATLVGVLDAVGTVGRHCERCGWWEERFGGGRVVKGRER